MRLSSPQGSAKAATDFRLFDVKKSKKGGLEPKLRSEDDPVSMQTPSEPEDGNRCEHIPYFGPFGKQH
jgi:hypothetical protein